jgi:hypothetical protein
MPTSYTIRFPDGTTYGPAEVGTLQQWAREGRLMAEAVLIPGDGSPQCTVGTMEALRPHVMAPPTVFSGLPEPGGDETVATLIPFRNMPALVGYYVSIASLIPAAGLVAGPAAVALGVVGYRKSRQQPRIKGAVHAWVAIVVGTLTSVANWGLVIMLLVLAAMA